METDSIRCGQGVYEGRHRPRIDHPEGIASQDGSIGAGAQLRPNYRIGPTEAPWSRSLDRRFLRVGLRHGDNSTSATQTRCGYEAGHEKRRPREVAMARTDAHKFQHPAFDADGCLYVSDSYAFKEPGPGIFRFGPDGKGELWYDEPIDFANGLALSADGGYLYVAETFGNAVFRVSIEDDGSAGMREEVSSLPVWPTGRLRYGG